MWSDGLFLEQKRREEKRREPPDELVGAAFSTLRSQIGDMRSVGDRLSPSHSRTVTPVLTPNYLTLNQLFF